MIEAQLRAALGFADERHDSGESQQPERQVDEEHPAPVEILGQIPAERRTQDRANHHADAPHRDRSAVLLLGIGVEQDRLRQCNE